MSGLHSLSWGEMQAKEAQMRLRCWEFIQVDCQKRIICIPGQELYPLAEDMEMSSRYEEAEYEEYGEEAEARIEPFRRRRKPYRFLILA